MWAEFKLRGEEPIKIYEKTQADPLFMEDCAGTFLLWLVMLASGPVGSDLKLIFLLFKTSCAMKPYTGTLLNG